MKGIWLNPYIRTVSAISQRRNGLRSAAPRCLICAHVSGEGLRCVGSLNLSAIISVAPAATALAQNGTAPPAIAIAPPVTADRARPKNPKRQALSSCASVSSVRSSLARDSYKSELSVPDAKAAPAPIMHCPITMATNPSPTASSSVPANAAKAERISVIRRPILSDSHPDGTSRTMVARSYAA